MGYLPVIEYMDNRVCFRCDWSTCDDNQWDNVFYCIGRSTNTKLVEIRESVKQVYSNRWFLYKFIILYKDIS